MSEELSVLKTVVERLEKSKIAYMITGSVAANFYTLPRMTRDIDIVIEVELKNIDELFGLFKKDFYVERDAIAQAIRERGMFNVIHNKSVMKVDFVIRKDAPYRTLEFKRRRRIKVGNKALWIVSPEDLVLSKMAWAKDSLSEVQLKDVKSLLESVKDIDTVYIQRWVKSLGLEKIYEKLKS